MATPCYPIQTTPSSAVPPESLVINMPARPPRSICSSPCHCHVYPNLPRYTLRFPPPQEDFIIKILEKTTAKATGSTPAKETSDQVSGLLHNGLRYPHLARKTFCCSFAADASAVYAAAQPGDGYGDIEVSTIVDKHPEWLTSLRGACIRIKSWCFCVSRCRFIINQA